ncbi:anaerobic selenocysteine-containing dehydrogenase [Desulfitispora alkaliphila]|uniref:molybdopterin-containing oxidoreductase family protein n=1 Tax=Desulfitispora alkaliphila TaxID=622674 RepID=UPI003D1B3692
MSEVFKTGCPLNCVDGCQLEVTVKDNKIMSIRGGTDNPNTRGFTCSKAQKQVRRMESVDRVTAPLYREDRFRDDWRPITWEEAYSILAEKLRQIKKEYDSRAVYHHFDYGSNGILRTLDRRFFNAYGGVTTYTGSVCWGSGFRAQELDFGQVQSSDWSDLKNSKTIILWGRDPAVTSIHMVPYIKEAREQGASVIAINPLKVKSTAFCDQHIDIRPGTDGALALGVAHVILNNRWLDFEFVSQNVKGFEEYAKLVAEYNPHKVAAITGVEPKVIENLARIVAKHRPVSILIGYGLQRYGNGGKTVRAIDALAAITGNLGRPGAGAHYAQGTNGQLLNSLEGEELAVFSRNFPVSRAGEEILNAQDPPIKAIFVTRSNPVSQLPNTAKVKAAFNSVDFVTVVDYHLNDTAMMANLVLPCTTIFEDWDLISTSWNNYLTLAKPIVPRRGKVKPDWEIFSELAAKLELKGVPQREPEEWLGIALDTDAARRGDITLQALSHKPCRNPITPQVAWEKLDFNTPSGKIELYSETDLKESGDALCAYVEPEEIGQANPLSQEFPYIFMTPHPEGKMHSQFAHEESEETWPAVEIHPETAEKHYVRNLDQVIVESPRGQVVGMAKLTSRVRPDTVVMEDGHWIKYGGGINYLTPDKVADLGEGTPYYDCRCTLRKVTE